MQTFNKQPIKRTTFCLYSSHLHLRKRQVVLIFFKIHHVFDKQLPWHMTITCAMGKIYLTKSDKVVGWIYFKLKKINNNKERAIQDWSFICVRLQHYEDKSNSLQIQFIWRELTVLFLYFPCFFVTSPTSSSWIRIVWSIRSNPLAKSAKKTRAHASPLHVHRLVYRLK